MSIIFKNLIIPTVDYVFYDDNNNAIYVSSCRRTYTLTFKTKERSDQVFHDIEEAYIKDECCVLLKYLSYDNDISSSFR